MHYTIHLSKEELAEQKLRPDTLKMAKHFFQTHGFLKIDNLFSKEFIQTLHTAYTKDLNYDLEEGSLENGTKASHRRHLVPIPFADPFNTPSL